jgi:hydroxylaminobenzene mutase
MTLSLDKNGRSLVLTGALLFLGGILQGFMVDQFVNPRMALSAHLDAVQSGMAVMLAGVLWASVRWTAALEAVARWTLAIGMVGLWLGITIAAMTGASEALPIAGKGFAAGPSIELITTAIIIGSSVALAVGWSLFVFGLFRSR